MEQNSRVGKRYAPTQTGKPLSTLVTPQFPNLPKVDLNNWKYAYLQAKSPAYPNRWLLYSIYDNIMIDGALWSLIEKRIIKVQKAKFNIMGKDGKINAEKTDLLKRLWFDDFLRYMMEAKFYGFSLVEAFDFLQNGEIEKITLIDRYHVKPEKGIVINTIYEQTGWDYLNGPISNYYLPIGKVDDFGLLYKAAPLIIAIKYAIGNWGSYNEKLGIPFRTVTSPGVNATRQKQLGVIMEQMGSAGWAVINENEKIELLQIAGSDPTKCFEMLISKLDDRLALLLIGQSSTTNSHTNTGTYGSMEMLADISEDIHDADLIYCGYYINNVLIPRLNLFGYGFAEGDKFTWDKTVDTTVSETVDYVVKLSDFYDIDPAFITEKTGIPIIGKKQIPVVVPPVSSIPPAKPVPKKKVRANKITAFYKETCCTDHMPVITAVDPGFDKIMRGVAKRIFDGKINGPVDKTLLKATATSLMDGLISGYVIPDDGLDQTDKAMFANLKENVYVFSGFKTEKMLKAASSLLLDADGKVRDKPDFVNEVLKLNPTYNGSYLDAERDNALVSGDMASKWIQIQKTKETLPYLVFDATLDNRTTNICRALDEFTAKADDPIWDTYFLPLHWHERSTIRQASTAVLTDQSKIVFPDVAPMFSTNVGKTGVIFPDTHPYFDDVSYKDAKIITKAATDAMNTKKK